MKTNSFSKHVCVEFDEINADFEKISDSTLRLIVVDLMEIDAFSMATTLLKLILLPYRAWFT